MAKGLIEHSTLTAIADAIRAKGNTSDGILPSNMANAITALSNVYMVTGTSTAANQQYDDAIMALGVMLPDSSNYTFIAGLYETGSGTGSDLNKGDAYFMLLRNTPDGTVNQVTGAADGGSVPAAKVTQNALRFDTASGSTRVRSTVKVMPGKQYWWCYIYG